MTTTPEFEEVVGTQKLLKELKNYMNNVNSTDVTLFTLAIAALGAVAPALSAHDYPVAGGLAILGVILVYLYHKFGSA